MREISNCILCGSDRLVIAIEAGVTLVKCASCDLLQTKRQEIKDYSQYKYTTNSERSDMLLAVVQKAKDAVKINQGDKVLDIGCGDGMLLGWYNKGTVAVGVDPSVPLVTEALKSHRADVAICDLFLASELKQHFKNMGGTDPLFKVITAVDVIDLVISPRTFLHDVKSLLHPQGVCILQTVYLGKILQEARTKEFTPERTAYYLAGTLGQVVRDVALEVSGAEFTPAGNMRLYLTHPEVDIYNDDPDHRHWLFRNWQYKLIEEIQHRYNEIDSYKVFTNKEVSVQRS